MRAPGPLAAPLAWAPLLADVPFAELLGPELARRYAEPQRHYHGLDHISALAQIFVDVAAGPGWGAPVEVKLAILFHDAIYEIGASDNEARSASLARTELAERHQELDLERIAMLIEATRDHGSDEARTAARDDPDLAHFLDADTAILGAPGPVYERYANQVRREFAAVPAPLYRAGRARFLRAQLAHPELFHSTWFNARYGAQAQFNIERELSMLDSPE